MFHFWQWCQTTLLVTHSQRFSESKSAFFFWTCLKHATERPRSYEQPYELQTLTQKKFWFNRGWETGRLRSRHTANFCSILHLLTCWLTSLLETTPKTLYEQMRYKVIFCTKQIKASREIRFQCAKMFAQSSTCNPLSDT